MKSQRPPRWQVACVAAVLLTVAFVELALTWQSSTPTSLPDLQQDKLACASYTPSHDGHILGVDATRALVRDDLKLLARRFGCIRTYSVSEGLDEVPKVARELGLKVMLGFWIGSNMADNNAEITHGLALANEYADIVTAVIVGNEVLLRRELPAAQLQSLLERVRAGTHIPVTYADVWEFWLRNPQLAETANFITIHILPYWEDQPIGIDHALDHVRSIYAKVQAAFPGREIFIGETGWPSVGRPRMEATPSLVNEARFVREFVAFAEQNRVPYNLIEAFDQPWKRIQEGTVGGFWGLYSSNREPKFNLRGPLPGSEFAQLKLLAALATAVAFALLGLGRPLGVRSRGIALLGLAGYSAGCVLIAQWEYLSAANRTTLEWVATLGWALIGWLSYVGSCLSLSRWIDDSGSASHPLSAISVLRSLGHRSSTAPKGGFAARVMGLSRFLFASALAYVCIALAYDGRGRDFPIALMALPVIAFALQELVATRSTADDQLENEELLLTTTILIATVVFAWNETFRNERAMGWSALCLLFVATLLAGAYRSIRQSRPNDSAEQQADTAQLKRV